MKGTRGQGRRLLLVEDYADLRDTLRDLLKLKGYRVQSARDGRQALHMMRSEGYRPDLVITDLKMPNEDGWSLRRRMLQDEKLAGVPVIVLSSAEAGSREELQAAAYLKKPVEAGELLQSIEDHCC